MSLHTYTDTERLDWLLAPAQHHYRVQGKGDRWYVLDMSNGLKFHRAASARDAIDQAMEKTK